MNDDEAVISAAEKIGRMALGEINIEEYQALLFQIGAMLAVWRMAMKDAGYSQYMIEKSAWLMLTSFYGHHLTNTEIDFEPPTGTYTQPVPEGGQGSDQGGEGTVLGPEG